MTERYRPIVIRFRKRWHGWAFALIGFAAFLMLERWNFAMMGKYQLVTMDSPLGIGLLLCFVVTATLCFVYVWPAGRVSWRFKSSLSAGAALTILAGVGGYHQLNAVLDSTRPEPRTFVIENLNCSSGRRHRPRLSLRPTDPLLKEFSLEVPAQECRSSLPGDSVFVEVKPGFFGSAWVARYTVVKRKH